ncbi:hypothetical protein FSHL1_000180 [Fusarium sambucinum]
MSSTQSPPFTYFRQFPPEIQLEILNHCTRNDLVCLSLTNHDFQAFITPLIKYKPQLEWVDQLGTTPDVPEGCPLKESNIYHRSYCKGPPPASNASSILQTILHAKYLFAKSTACVFRVPFSSDYAAGWARGDTAANVHTEE